MTNNDEGDAYIIREGSELGAVERSFEWLQNEWQDPDNRKTVIAVPSKRNLDSVCDRLVPLIGESAFRSLTSSENHAELGKGVELFTMTKRIQPHGWDGGPVLGLFVDDEQLTEITQLPNIASILVVSWHRDDANEWAEKVSPKELHVPPK